MSDKSKRKAKPERKSAKLIGSIAVLILLISVAFIMNWQAHKNLEPPIPDYSATATQIIASATQTAISLEAEGCERVDVTGWQVNIFFYNNVEMDGYGRNATRMSNWLCDDDYRYDHTEFYINVFIETEDIDFVSLIDDVILFLEDYPPDNVPLLPPLIDLSITQPSINLIPSESFRMNYDDLMEAFDSGLRGSELLEAVATPIE